MDLKNFMHPLSKNKFCQQSEKRKHRLCLQIVKDLYESSLKEKFLDNKLKNILKSYREIENWLGLPLVEFSVEGLSDRYHFHLKLSEVYLSEHDLLPNIRRSDRVSAEPALPICIYLDNIRSAHNIGSVVRTTEAFSLGSLFFSSEMPFVDHDQVKKTSMQCSKWVECHKGVLLEDLPRPIIALETSSDARSLDEMIFPESFTLVLGNEEYGCSDKALKLADYVLEIPLFGKKNSLNVANAFAIVGAEIRRQRALVSRGVR